LGCAPVARLTIEQGRVWEERGGRRASHHMAPLRALEQMVMPERFISDPDLPPLSAGAVGSLAHHAVRAFAPIPHRHGREGPMPDGLFLLFDAVVAFDHPRQRLLLLTNVDVADEREKEKEVDAAIVRLDRLEAFLSASEVGRPAATVGGEDTSSATR